MKHLFFTLFAVLTLTASPAFAAGETVHIKVLGLVCEFCARTIEKVFMKTEAVESVNVDLDKALITLAMKDGKTFTDKFITEQITEAGYTVNGIHHMGEMKDE